MDKLKIDILQHNDLLAVKLHNTSEVAIKVVVGSSHARNVDIIVRPYCVTVTSFAAGPIFINPVFRDIPTSIPTSIPASIPVAEGIAFNGSLVAEMAAVFASNETAIDAVPVSQSENAPKGFLNRGWSW